MGIADVPAPPHGDAMMRLAQRVGARVTLLRRIATALACAIAIACAASVAQAHDQAFSYVDVTLAQHGATVTLSVHRKDAALALGLASPDSLATAQGVLHYGPALLRMLGPRLNVSADQQPRPMTWTQVELASERRAVEFTGHVSWLRRPGQIGVDARMFPDNPLHETFVNVYEQRRLLRQEVLTDTKRSFDMYTSGAEAQWAVFVTFVRAGIHHIFIGPDHILFVIGLLLLGGGVGRILKITSGFTLAHSITLALATLGVFQPPARIIEPAIALSIIYVGIDNLRRRGQTGGRDRRVWVAFVFGLVHGFGFASVLTQLGLPRQALGTSLLAFNVGVEIGQACIVLAAIPLIALLRSQWPRIAPRALAFASWGVVAAGGWWFVERVFLGG